MYRVDKAKPPEKKPVGSVADQLRDESLARSSFDDQIEQLEPGDRCEWLPMAGVLVDLRGWEAVAQGLLSNFLSFGSVGSRVPYLENRLRIVKALADADNAKLVKVARMIVDEIEKEIRRFKKEDEQHAAGIY
jgi:hypothetical protein